MCIVCLSYADCEIMRNCFAEYGKTESTKSVEAEESVSVAFLVRERSALADPYCQSAWNSVCLSVCLLVCPQL